MSGCGVGLAGLLHQRTRTGIGEGWSGKATVSVRTGGGISRAGMSVPRILAWGEVLMEEIEKLLC